jgi:hypothetical protein
MKKSDNHLSIMERFFNIRLSDAILLALFPVCAYITVFFYYKGYFEYFGIPLPQINFNLVNILIISFSIGLILWLIFGVVNLVSTFLIHKKSNPSIVRRAWMFFPVLAYVIGMFFIYLEISLSLWLPSLIALVIFGFALFVLPVFGRKGKYVDRLADADKGIPENNNPWEGNLLDRLFNFLGRKLLYVLLYIYIFLSIVFQVGISNAITQKNYYVINSIPEMVILYMDNEDIICAPFDREIKKVSSEFKILRISENSDLTYQLEIIGPLRSKNYPILISTKEMSATTVAAPTISDSLITISPTSIPSSTPIK